MNPLEKIRMLDPDRLYEVLDYDPRTGVFTWKVRLSPKCREPAGSLSDRGYRRIQIDGITYLAHHLAWLYHYDAPPPRELGFRNGDTTDIRIKNLRPMSPTELARRAKKPRNKTGYRGVRKFHNRYHSVIRTGKKRLFLGTFATAEAAYRAFCKKAKELHGQFARLK